jgi:hypothetical protein
MGRPLNKKYFGNRNIGVNGYDTVDYNAPADDDKIGGEGIASILFSNPGNYINRLPTFASFSDPSLPDGVRAQTVLHSRAQNATPLSGARGGGYAYGQIITDTNGSTWRVTALRVVAVSKTANGSNYDNDNDIVFDSAIDAKWTTALTMSVDTNSAGALGNFTVTQYGVWTGSGAPTHVICTTANTRNGADQNASGAEFNLDYGVESVELVASADYAYGTSYAYGASNVQVGATVPAGGTGVQLDVGFGAHHIVVTQKGSGYIGSETVTFTTTSGGGEVTAVGTFVLTTDSGAVGSATNQENAIVAYGWVDGAREIVDIIKQTSSRRYRLKGADGYVRSAILVAHSSNANSQVDVTAYDSDNNQYWVTKITAHKALLTRKISGNGQFATGTNVKWTFGNAEEDVSVKIQNA